MQSFGVAIVLALSTLLGDIKSDEEVVFYPTYAFCNAADDVWTVRIHGHIYEPEESDELRQETITACACVLGLTEDDAEFPIFRTRARPFLADNERGKRILVRLGDRTHRMTASTANGHFDDDIEIPAKDVAKLVAGSKGPDGWIAFHAVTRLGDDREFAGAAQAIDAEGVSVISDIDDTIKDSGVDNTRRLLENTFLKEYKPTRGMADAYAAWSERGAVFHYVSASPWQLFAPLDEFLAREGFPAGSLHLQHFRLKDESFCAFFAERERYKAPTIAAILKDFPDRKFILVGDASETDPEIYAELARRHPSQIFHIFIRDPHADAASDERMQKIFADLPDEQWTVFQDGGELRDYWPAGQGEKSQ